MSQPTTGILLNSTAPAAPAGNQNVKPQSDGATPLQSISFYPQPATAALLGVVKPDGTSITVDATGKISAVGGSGPTVTHDEPLTDGNANFLFAASLSEGGDILVVTGVPN
ncbi:MAG: hypothetical protein ACYCSP_05895 [Acidobacteriaceae bacterium]